MRDFTNRTTQLEHRRAELIARMQTLDTELDSHGDPDWEDSATEHEQDEAMEALGLSAQAEVQMIDAALSRISAGEYGACMRCGAEISEDRLDLLPATPFCRDCAR